MSRQDDRHLGAVVRECVKHLRATGAKSHAKMLADAFILAASPDALRAYCGEPTIHTRPVDVSTLRGFDGGDGIG